MVRYAGFSEAWRHFEDFLRRQVESGGVRDLCEVGGANTALSLQTVEEHGLRYTILDVSAEELAKAPAGYRKLQADVASQPHRARSEAHGKFPALYAWCRGPTARQIACFERLGYAVEEYTGFFRHDYYCSIPPLQRLADGAASLLRRHPIPQLTSYAFVVLRKPVGLGVE